MTTENPEPLTPGVEAFLKRWEETDPSRPYKAEIRRRLLAGIGL